MSGTGSRSPGVTRPQAAAAVIDVVPRLGRLMRRRIESMSGGHSIIRYGALKTLAARTCSNAELAAELSVSEPTMSAVVDGLVKAGWVEREVDARDRRAVRLSLTEAGRDEVEGVRAELVATLGEVLGRVGDEDLRALMRGLRALAGALAGPAERKSNGKEAAPAAARGS